MGNTDRFEMMANSYDTADRIQIAKIIADQVRDCLVDAKNKNVIDFGCGTGLVGMNLMNDFKSVLFLDTSQNMIRQIEQKISNFNFNNASTLCVDFEKDVKTDLHADYIIMAQVLLHILDTDLILSRLYEVLNAGGHLMIVDFDKNDKVVSDLVHNGFIQTELGEQMAKIGFQVIQSKTFYYGSKLFMNQDASLFILDAIK